MAAIDPHVAPAHRPVRTCLGCRTRRPQAELVRLCRRVDRAAEATIVVVDGPSDGRGGWLCRDRVERCLDDAVRSRRFERAWRTTLNAGDHDEIRRALRPLTSSAVVYTTDETSGGNDAAAVGMTTGKG